MVHDCALGASGYGVSEVEKGNLDCKPTVAVKLSHISMFFEV